MGLGPSILRIFRRETWILRDSWCLLFFSEAPVLVLANKQDLPDAMSVKEAFWRRKLELKGEKDEKRHITTFPAEVTPSFLNPHSLIGKWLGGGFKHFVFSALLGEMIQID